MPVYVEACQPLTLLCVLYTEKMKLTILVFFLTILGLTGAQDCGRLPTSLSPSHYLVRLQPFVNTNQTIIGYVEITFNCLEATNNITLHIQDIETKNQTILLNPSSDPTGPGLPFTSHNYDHTNQFYIGMLESPLQAGTEYIISMEFEGFLNNDLRGFYLSQYENENNATINLGTTQFQATDARRAFPCFDEPGIKATFKIEMAREIAFEQETISNMPKIDEQPIVGQRGWVWDIFDVTPPMSTYLVAFVVSDFANISSTDGSVLFRVWARPSAINQANYAISIGPSIMTFFENYFNIPFPLPKQDMIALPDFDAGAMENWGLITYRETAMLYDSQLSSASNKQRVALVVAHELAHMWFGDLVTPVWWQDIWLNEGFASYMQYLGVDAVEPTFKFSDQFLNEELQYAFGLDGLESSHPINQAVCHPSEIGALFDAISYSKGASIIRMMNYFLTPATFNKGVTNYLLNFTYGNAEQDDLWAFLTDAAYEDGTLSNPLTVKLIMDTWTLQMGYPVITVIRDGSGSANLTQERFLLAQSSNSTENYMWYVPISYTSQGNSNFTATNVVDWMTDQETNKVLTGMAPQSEWMIFNVQETYYYRVNYDINNWNLLVSQMNTFHNDISDLNRAQLNDDSLNLARADKLQYSLVLDLMKYLRNEDELVPMTSALDNLNYLETMFTRTAGYSQLQEFLLYLLNPGYARIGYTDNLLDPHTDQLYRSRIVNWVCHLNNADCITNAQADLDNWMATPNDYTIVSPNLKSTVYCEAVENGDATEWDFEWNRYINSDLGTEQSYLLYGMACSTDVPTLSAYLDDAFTDGSGIRKQDAYKVFGGVSDNDIGRDIAWDYLVNNYQKIADYYGYNSVLSGMANTASSEFNTQSELLQLQAFKNQVLVPLGVTDPEIDQAIERTQNNIDWMARHYDEIMQWLNDNGPFENLLLRKHY